VANAGKIPWQTLAKSRGKRWQYPAKPNWVQQHPAKPNIFKHHPTYDAQYMHVQSIRKKDTFFDTV